jgi:hypothetical protein
MISLIAIAFTLSSAVVAQVQPAPAVAAPATLNNGPCLDSQRAVPNTLQGTTRGEEVVKIDKIRSTSTMTDGEIIGYLYTRQDGTTWLSQRADQYMSAADSSALNQVLNSTHMPGSTVTAFPPKTKLGVKTGYPEFFQVQIPVTAWDPLRIRIEPCVAWPPSNPLPDPS